MQRGGVRASSPMPGMGSLLSRYWSTGADTMLRGRHEPALVSPTKPSYWRCCLVPCLARRSQALAPPVKGSSSPATGQWWCVPASRTVPAQRIGTPALSEKTISNLVISDLGSMMEGSRPRPDLSSAGPCRRACLRREMDHGGIGANNEAAECLAGWHSTAHGQGERGTSCCTAGPIGIMPGFKSQRSELERAKR